ncbi:hypothetical protein CR513_58244, partial [Mucuna pruriens]
EDCHKHLKEFHVVCSTTRPQGILEDYIKIKAFPFSLDGGEKDWLYLQPTLFNTRGDMKSIFLEKFFPTSRTTTIRKEICGIRQHTRETLHEYWERFNKLYATCPHNQINDQLLIQYFYKKSIDGQDTSSSKAPDLQHGNNMQQFGIRGSSQSQMVNEIGVASNQKLENQLTELTSLVRQLAVGQHQPTMAIKVCGICTSVKHPTDMCPTLQEIELDELENVGAIGGFQYGKQPYQSRPLDNQQHGRQPFRPGSNQGPYAAQQFGLSTSNSAIPSTTFPTTATTKNAASRKFPISEGSNEAASHHCRDTPRPTLNRMPTHSPRQDQTVPVPFPTRTISARKPESDEELLKMFRKVEINIPVLDAIK